MSNITSRFTDTEFCTRFGRVLGVADGFVEPLDKRTRYKTAVARIACAAFKAGDFVKVKHHCVGRDGTHYFLVNGTVVYPEHQLERFCL